MGTSKNRDAATYSGIQKTLIKSLQTPAKVAVRLLISEKNWLESTAVDQLKKTAELTGMCCAIGMPDLHPGKGQPIGAAFVTRNHVYPHLVGSDIGCGMGLWQLDVKKRQVKPEKWEKRLIDLDDSWYSSDSVPELEGDFFKEENIKLGTIGGGNHFAEIQQVHETFDEAGLSALGLDRQSVVFLAHSGSRGLGQKILRNHVDHYGGQSLSPGMQDKNGGYLLDEYLKQHNYAVEWAVINRKLITERFCERLGVKSRALLDVAHNTVTALDETSVAALGLPQQPHDRFWIHRKGASPTNEGLVMIPGSRGSLSYLVKPRVAHPHELAAGGFSLAHGAGRKWKRSESKGRLERRFKIKDLEVTDLGSHVICKQKDLLYEEAPQAYKNISLVIDDLVQAGMIDLVASFKPLLTYKTRRR